MSVESDTLFWARCDECEVVLGEDDDQARAFSFPTHALAAAKAAGWVEDGDRLICRLCAWSK